MFGFVELTTLNGTPIVINLGHVETIHPGYDAGEYYSCLMMDSGKIVRVMESYDEIMEMFDWEDDEE